MQHIWKSSKIMQKDNIGWYKMLGPCGTLFPGNPCGKPFREPFPGSLYGKPFPKLLFRNAFRGPSLGTNPVNGSILIGKHGIINME